MQSICLHLQIETAVFLTVRGDFLWKLQYVFYTHVLTSLIVPGSHCEVMSAQAQAQI